MRRESEGQHYRRCVSWPCERCRRYEAASRRKAAAAVIVMLVAIAIAVAVEMAAKVFHPAA